MGEMEMKLSALAHDVQALKDMIAPVVKGRVITKADACKMLDICLKTFITYYERYQLPIESPRKRNVRYTYEELARAAEILRQHGRLRHGSIFTERV